MSPAGSPGPPPPPDGPFLPGALLMSGELVERLSAALGADVRELRRDELNDRLDRLTALRLAAAPSAYPERGVGGLCESCGCAPSTHHRTGGLCSRCPGRCTGWRLAG